MRTSFLTLTLMALIASGMTAASAFNYATMSRSIGASIVSDNGNAFISIEGSDAAYTCMLAWSDGKIDFTIDNGGGACTGAGTGVNPDSVYYFSDVLKVTNKGQKALTGLWLNFTDDIVQSKTATSSGTNMATTSGWARETAVGSLAVGASVYVSFKVDTDTTNLDTTDSPQTKSMTIQARATN